ncbi:MAG: c-type cytochrome [Rhodothermales bacterium]|nr:c-type cytochrome [Rhodothermales bacterium]
MKNILKWTLRIILGIVLLLVIAGFAMVMIGGSKAGKVYDPVDGLLSTVQADSLALVHGEHLSHILGCTDCHGSNLAGQVMDDVPPFTLASANITPGRGGAVSNYSVKDWDRAIRHGIKPDGSGILIMPSASYNKISDSDAEALIAYLQTLPAVDNDVPKAKVKTLGKLILAMGAPFFEATTAETDATGAEYGATVEFGRYFASAMCSGCHGKEFEGGPGFEPGVPAPSLLSAAKWSTDEFIRTLQSGVKPNGDSLSQGSMPASYFRNYTRDELTGIHLYLEQVFE